MKPTMDSATPRLVRWHEHEELPVDRDTLRFASWRFVCSCTVEPADRLPRDAFQGCRMSLRQGAA